MSGMSLFQWRDEYLVGNTIIDGQHKRLFQLADKFDVAMQQGKATATMQGTLSELIDYTKGHFATEERLMQQSKYLDYPRHKQEHDRLTLKVVEFQANFADRKATTSDVLMFLKDWLTHHIGETDTKIAAHLRAQK